MSIISNEGVLTSLPKKILFIGTGGTISSLDSGEGLSSSLPVEEILRFCSDKLKGIEYEADIIDFLKIDSTLIQPEDWINLAKVIGDMYSKYDGFIVLHGTDTLAYTASMLSFMLRNISKTVILTGSMKPAPIANSDAIDNVSDSVRFTAEGCPGVFVVFNHKVIKAARASKIASKDIDAFVSVNEPPIALMTTKGIEYDGGLLKGAVLAGIDAPFTVDTRMDNNIFVLKIFPGLEPYIIEYLMEKEISGLIVESFGAGGLPYRGRNLLDVLSKAAAKIPVVMTSQALYNGVSLNTYEVGVKALKAGIISAGDMSKEAAITKLMWVLGHTNSIDEIREIFATSLAGEISLQPQTKETKAT